jgi:TetR/AcrR family transcriptional regulator, lmrAB and yxaGH operons repressor
VIVAATLEGDREPTVRDAAGQALDAWEEGLADALRTRDVPAGRARSIATLVIASIEGAIVLARAQRHTRPLERVSRELQQVIRGALAEAGAVRGG